MASGCVGVGVGDVHPGLCIGDIWSAAVREDLEWSGCWTVDGRGAAVSV